jgi:hypothetical protein
MACQLRGDILNFPLSALAVLKANGWVDLKPGH